VMIKVVNLFFRVLEYTLLPSRNTLMGNTLYLVLKNSSRQEVGTPLSLDMFHDTLVFNKLITIIVSSYVSRETRGVIDEFFSRQSSFEELKTFFFCVQLVNKQQSSFASAKIIVNGNSVIIFWVVK